MSETDYLPFGRPSFGDEEIEAVSRVLRSAWVGMGGETLAFEQDLARWIGVPHVVSLSSCSAALILALKTLSIGPGDEVICPSLTWCSSANAALHLGAAVRFCDLDPDSLNLDPASVVARLTPSTRAVVAVHFGGLAIDVEALARALPPGIAIVEDAAHALGARYPSGGRVGSSGNLTCFSFYANKNLSTAEGGAISTFDAVVAERLQRLRLHGLPVDAWARFLNPQATGTDMALGELGYKMNYTDLQAAIGRVQLRRQDEFAALRLDIARIYARAMDVLAPHVTLQRSVLDAGHARHLFVVLLPRGCDASRRNEVVRAMRRQGIGAAIHYPPLHRMPLYAPAPHLPATEDVCDRILTLPIGAGMGLDDARRAADVATAVIRREFALP